MLLSYLPSFTRAIGVYLHTASGKWVASINHSGKSHYLGTFDTEEAAAKAYDEAARRLRTNPILNFLPDGSLNPDRKTTLGSGGALIPRNDTKGEASSGGGGGGGTADNGSSGGGGGGDSGGGAREPPLVDIGSILAILDDDDDDDGDDEARPSGQGSNSSSSMGRHRSVSEAPAAQALSLADNISAPFPSLLRAVHDAAGALQSYATYRWIELGDDDDDEEEEEGKAKEKENGDDEQRAYATALRLLALVMLLWRECCWEIKGEGGEESRPTGCTQTLHIVARTKHNNHQ
jgi:hypothetical protein